MKGIILAAGKGTRLYPITKTIAKPLLPIYDKPMIYYPLYTLMEAGIKDIMIITSPDQLENFKKQLGTGENFGIKLSYAIQEVPLGIADAFRISRDFIKGDTSVLTFGDNLFIGKNMTEKLQEAIKNLENGYVSLFGIEVPDPERFGVMELSNDGNIISIEEKPLKPKSNLAATGLYFYDESVINKFDKLKPSARGEYEITDINNLYLAENKIKGIVLDRENFVWEDTGTIDSVLNTSLLIQKMEKENNQLINSPESLAYQNKWIDREQLEKTIHENSKTIYGEYLKELYEKN